ncbi:adenine-specific methyltransferase EcoRI family protein [Spiroplasma endosymbiont of Dioctria linearis]|uniref:adenine-specific methyltransferase EcoRI family protein n=1 Tax=Spiroplasma endosymbiont of Dioctria linearis TaxID=3066290 RepID=UPI00313C7654
MAKNADLRKADKNKNDEFYTTLETIEDEIRYYPEKFLGKTVLCNCDDPELLSVLKNRISVKRFKIKTERTMFYERFKDKELLDNASSQFWVYFHKQFKFLGLKKLIATHYKEDGGKSYAMVYDGTGDDSNIYNFDMINFKTSNGDFRSDECIELLKESDIVVTNPPFSLFREFIDLMEEYGKQYSIIGNVNAITYKNVFPLIKENKVWLGKSIHSGDRWFAVPEHYGADAATVKIDKIGRKFIKVKGVRWYTNLDFAQRHEELVLTDKYDNSKNPKYDNYDAINVDVTKSIPENYYEPMGVPITFLDKFSPDQFEIIDGIGRYSIMSNKETKAAGNYLSMINGVAKYFRIIIKRKNK